MGLGVEEKLLLERLRDRPRRGWLRLGVPVEECETVRDHTLKLGCAARIYPGTTYSRNLSYTLSITHDFCECDGEDYTPYDNIPADEKRRREWESLCKTTENMGDAGQRIRNFWMLYADKLVPEAILVSQLDKLDSAVQAIEYQKRGYDTSAFFPYVEERLVYPQLQNIFRALTTQPSSENAYRRYFRMLRAL